MSVALLMLFSGKGGTVRGCLSGSLWLKSVGLVSISPAEAISPGSAATFRFLPAPGARSKFSSITAGLSVLTLRTALEKEEEMLFTAPNVFPFA